MFIFDILLIALVGYSFYYGFKHGISKPLYELTIIFIGFTLAGKYAYSMGVFLTKHKILMADNIALLTLIGFLILFLLYWLAVYLLEKIKKVFLENGFKTTSMIIGGSVNAIQVLIVSTLLIFLFNQFTIGKKGLRVSLLKSYSYPKVERVYKNVFTKTFVDNIIKGNMTGTNANELLIQTITDEKVLESIKK